MAPTGVLKKALLEDKFTQYASYLTEEVCCVCSHGCFQLI